MNDLTDRLQHLGTLLSGIVRRFQTEQAARARAYALDALAATDSDKLTVLPVILPLAFDEDPNVADQATRTIQRLTVSLRPSEWHWLETRFRAFAWSDPWAAVKIGRLERLEVGPIVVLRLLSFHRDGYIRESAVQMLAGRSEGELPFLLMRLNDWVEPVHRAALDACGERLRPERAADFVQSLPYVTRLRDAGRRDLTPFVAAVEDLLMSPECRPALLDGLTAQDPTVRRASFRLALRSSGEDAQVLLDRALQSHDLPIRLAAARALRALPSGDPVQVALMPRLAQDTLAAVRREYIYLCHDKYPDQEMTALREFLLDGHPSVRSAARYYLQTREPTDFPAFYRSRLEVTDARQLAAAVSGLGETGKPEDAVSVARFLRHPATVVRCAAITALGRLSPEDRIGALLQAVSDKRSAVSRAACEALLPWRNLISEAGLLGAWENASTQQARTNVLRLMLALSKWRGGVLLLRTYAAACERNHPEGAKKAENFLQVWLDRDNTSAAYPMTAQVQEMKHIVERYQSGLGPGLLSKMRFVLKAAERFAT